MGRENQVPNQVIYVCTGSTCKKKGGKDIAKKFKKLIKEYNLKNDVEIIKTDCTDRCKLAPIVCLQPHNFWLSQFRENQVDEVFKQQILGTYTSDNL